MHQVHRPSSRLSGAQLDSHLLFRSSFLSFAHNFHSRQTYSTLLLKKKHEEAENRQLRRGKCRAAELTRSRLRLGIVDARCRMDFEEIKHVGEENDEVLRQAPKIGARLVMQIYRSCWHDSPSHVRNVLGQHVERRVWQMLLREVLDEKNVENGIFDGWKIADSDVRPRHELGAVEGN